MAIERISSELDNIVESDAEIVELVVGMVENMGQLKVLYGGSRTVICFSVIYRIIVV